MRANEGCDQRVSERLRAGDMGDNVLLGPIPSAAASDLRSPWPTGARRAGALARSLNY
jgi:hypothetical protein